MDNRLTDNQRELFKVAGVASVLDRLESFDQEVLGIDSSVFVDDDLQVEKSVFVPGTGRQLRS